MLLLTQQTTKFDGGLQLMLRNILLIITFLIHGCLCPGVFAQTYIKGPALVEGFSQITTSAGTTTLTKDSQSNQFLSGTMAHTVQLPSALTIPSGRYFVIQNKSTQSITVNDGSGSLLTAVPAGTQIKVTAVSVASIAGSWNVSTYGGGLVGILGADQGGTGLDGSSAANGSLLIGNGTGYSLATLTGTANQVSVTNGSGSITLSTPQNIATTSSPTFNGLTLSSLGSGFVKSTSGVLGYSGSVVLTTDVNGVLPLANGGSNKSMTASAGSVVYSDSDSFEMSGAGTAGQILQSNGTSAPSWVDDSRTLQDAYALSTQPQITLTAAKAGVFIRDAATPIAATLFAVKNNAGTTSYLGVDTNGISTTNFVGSGTTGAVRLHNLTTTQKNALTPAAGMMVYDTTLGRFECYTTAWNPCGTGRVVGSQLTLTASGTVTITTTLQNESVLVQGNSAAVVLSTTPFGSSAPIDGYRITLIGNSDTNTVQIPFNDAAKGVYGYTVTLGKGQTVTYEYNATLDRYVIIGASN